MHLWVSPFMEPPKWVGSKHDKTMAWQTHDFRPTTPIQKRALNMCRKHLLGAWEQGRSSVSTLGSWFRPSIEKQPWIKLGMETYGDSLWDIFYHQSNIGVDQQTLWGCAGLHKQPLENEGFTANGGHSYSWDNCGCPSYGKSTSFMAIVVDKLIWTQHCSGLNPIFLLSTLDHHIFGFFGALNRWIVEAC